MKKSSKVTKFRGRLRLKPARKTKKEKPIFPRAPNGDSASRRLMTSEVCVGALRSRSDGLKVGSEAAVMAAVIVLVLLVGAAAGNVVRDEGRLENDNLKEWLHAD